MAISGAGDAAASPQNPFDVEGRIAALWVYPVKSCAGMSLPQVELTEAGLDLDRAWMIVDAQGRFVTQREHPRLALVQPDLRAAGSELRLRAPGMLALHLQVDVVEAPVRVRVWDDEVPAYDMGDLAAQWFTDYLAQDASGTGSSAALQGGSSVPSPASPARYRLVRFDPEHRRLSSLKWTGGVEALNQFSDGYPILVLSQAAIDDLNRRLQAAGHPAVDARRFRPNVLLEGFGAHDEDRVGPLQVQTDVADANGAELTPVKPCPRCPVPNIDPDTARSHPGVGDAMQAYRQDPRVGGAITFGMNVIVTRGDGQVLKVGQAVRADYRFD